MKVVRLSALRTGRLYPPRKYSWYSFLLEAESTPGPQCGRKDYVNEKFPLTLSGIEPATSRLVAQCLNQLRHGVPHLKLYISNVLHTRKPLIPTSLHTLFHSRSGVVSIATRLRVEQSGVRIFLFPQDVETASGSHPGVSGFFPRGYSGRGVKVLTSF